MEKKYFFNGISREEEQRLAETIMDSVVDRTKFRHSIFQEILRAATNDSLSEATCLELFDYAADMYVEEEDCADFESEEFEDV